MLFVPVPLFATVLLSLVAIRFVQQRDMSLVAHRLFALLVVLYAVQSLLLSLRWGYGWTGIAPIIGGVALVLPVIAYLAFASLKGPLKGARLWPLGVIALNVVLFVIARLAADVIIFVTFIGFGILLVRLALKGPDQMALSPLDDARSIVWAAGLTGVTLIISGLTDVYVIIDFIRNEGRNVGWIVTVVQTAFVLIIGVSAAFGRVSVEESGERQPSPQTEGANTQQDSDIMARLIALFEAEGLHRDEELSLRRMARRLGEPDRKVSNAINRTSGLSVSQFVNEYRIKEACTLLANTQDTVLAVSLAAGFASKSNFNREFLRVTGTTPSNWRDQQAKGQ